MIFHHQSAIDMSQSYLKYGNDDELKSMATDMIAKQQEEIISLQNILLELR